MNRKLINKKAFTLIELLIVIAIIGILFIVLVSKVDFATDKAKATGVQTDFRSFQMAFDTIAKENAGFNTFGWDTGDANQDGIRNSYDEGDNGAGGGTAKNGIQDGAEVFTGHKVYAETFTKVYSLKKNGTGSYDREALNRLETAINANLDPKLHMTIKDDGEIVMANGAKDPWNKEYHGWYITNAETDGKDRGAIVLYSDGANNEFGSAHTIANGVVSVTIPNSNKNGKDDYSIVSVYTYVNGYGEVKNVTSGFSNNQSFLNGGSTSGTTQTEPWENADPGIYTDGNYSTAVSTWDDLVLNRDIILSNNSIAGANSNLSGTIIIPEGITLDNGAFQACRNLTGVILPSDITKVSDGAFADCENLKVVVLSDKITSIGRDAFLCTSITSLVLPDTVKNIDPCAFQGCKELKTLYIGSQLERMEYSIFDGTSDLTVHYNGTVESWNNMVRPDTYGTVTNLTVVCTDGTFTVG